MAVSSVNASLLPVQMQGKEAANNTLSDKTGAKESQGSQEALGKTTVEKFLDYVNMNPIERIRASYLEDQGITEEQLAKMPPDEREKVEKAIAQLIEQKLTGGSLGGGTGQALDVSA